MFLMSILIGKMTGSSVEENIDKGQSINIVKIIFGKQEFRLIDDQWLNQKRLRVNIQPTIEKWKQLLSKRGTPLQMYQSPHIVVLIYLQGLNQPIEARLSMDKNKTLITFQELGFQFDFPEEEYDRYNPQFLRSN